MTDRPDLRAPPGVPVAPPTRPARDVPPAVAVTVGLGAPWLLFFLLWGGHQAIDRVDPRTALAGVLYATGVAAAAGVGWWTARGLGRRPLLWGLAGALPVGLWAAYLATGYSYASIVTVYLFVNTLGPVWLLAAAATAIVAWRRGRTAALAVAAGGGYTLTGGLGLAMLMHLVTLRQQAEAAREAHEAPGVAAVVVILVLLALAWTRRRG